MTRFVALTTLALPANLPLQAADKKPTRVALLEDNGAFGKGIPRATKQLDRS
jgi:hypothetical protein